MKYFFETMDLLALSVPVLAIISMLRKPPKGYENTTFLQRLKFMCPIPIYKDLQHIPNYQEIKNFSKFDRTFMAFALGISVYYYLTAFLFEYGWFRTLYLESRF